jgi:uncharacterized delta-60 repeat protein
MAPRPASRRALLRTIAPPALVAASVALLIATPGSLDPTFGDQGLVVGYPGDPHALALQPDGAIVVAAQYGSTLARFLEDGTRDLTFAGYGRRDGYGAEALALDAFGRILVAGTMGSDFVVARYTSTGLPDPGFGAGGMTRIDVAGDADWAYGLALDASGRIVVAGSTLATQTSIDFAVARLTPDGGLDATFGRGGVATADFDGGIDMAVDVAVDSRGRIVLAGHAGGGTDEDFAAVRYTEDGVADPSFGTDGRRRAVFSPGREIAEAMSIDREDRVIVAGRSELPGMFSDFAVTRFEVDGSVDTSFGAAGLAQTDFFGMDDVAQGVAVDDGDRVVAFGRAQTSPGYTEAGFALALARYTPGGVLDAAFGAGGTVTTSLAEPMAWWGSVAIDASARIVVAATVDHSFALARYLTDESPRPAAVSVNPADPRHTVSLVASQWVDVAVLSRAGWTPPSAIAPGTMAFGRSGDEPSLLRGKNQLPVCKSLDVDRDGLPDLCCRFVVASTGLRPGDTTAVLTGALVGGTRFEGRGRIVVVP